MPKSAYHLIKEDLSTYCKKLSGFPESPFWIHETVLSNYIGLPRGRSGAEEGQQEAMTSLLLCIKKGYGGTQRDKDATGIAASDLADQQNNMHICYQEYGAKEPFQRGNLADGPLYRSPRWFHFGREDVPRTVKEQVKLVNLLTGSSDCSADDSFKKLPATVVRRRRKQQFKYFFAGERSDCTPFMNYDVPAIAASCIDIWEGVEMTSDVVRRRSFHPRDLDMIETDFRIMLVATNIIGKFVHGDGNDITACLSRRSARGHRLANNNSQPTTTPAAAAPPSTPRPPPTLVVTPPPATGAGSGSDVFPDTLRLAALRCTDEGAILWDMVNELASLELMFQLHIRNAIPPEGLEEAMAKMGQRPPTHFGTDEIITMSDKSKYNVTKNIGSARDDLISVLDGHFEPSQDELLWEWLRDARGYTDGRRVEADIFELNTGNRRTELSTRSRFQLREICFTYNIPVNKIGTWATI